MILICRVFRLTVCVVVGLDFGFVKKLFQSFFVSLCVVLSVLLVLLLALGMCVLCWLGWCSYLGVWGFQFRVCLCCIDFCFVCNWSLTSVWLVDLVVCICRFEVLVYFMFYAG